MNLLDMFFAILEYAEEVPQIWPVCLGNDLQKKSDHETVMNENKYQITKSICL